MSEDVYASVDLGGTTTRVALGTADGRVLTVDEFPTASHEGPDAVLKRIGESARRLADREDVRPKRLGIGLPGLVDRDAGVARFLPNLPGHWRDQPVNAPLEAAVGCEVRLLNDVRQHTMGELAFGVGRGKDHLSMVYIGIGTGIGGGIVIDGHLRLGPLGAAGEIGHMTILPSGPLCGCGNRGCLETLASGPAISAAGVRVLDTGQAPALHDLTEGNADRVNGKTLAEAAERGDKAVVEVLRQTGEFLGIGLANLVTALHPDLVVIGGGVSLIGEPLLGPIRETIDKRVRMFDARTVELLPSKLGDDAGMLGGIASAAFGLDA